MQFKALKYQLKNQKKVKNNHQKLNRKNVILKGNNFHFQKGNAINFTAKEQLHC